MTIDIVAQELDAWRRGKARHERMPQSLVSKIIGLTSQHRRFEIRRRLRLSNAFFSSHSPQRNGARAPKLKSVSLAGRDPAFVRVDNLVGTQASLVSFEVELPNGLRVRFF